MLLLSCVWCLSVCVCLLVSVRVARRFCSGREPLQLRDLSGVFQGMLSASPRRITTVPGFMRLWVHENRRVFQDRLINDEDRTWLDILLGQTLHSHFKIDFSEIMPTHALLFGDYLEMGGESRMYDEVKDPEKAVAIMNEVLNDYNDENTKMSLILFMDAVEHISRISRILRQPGGNALLLGVGGSGRQSLTKLATFMAEYELFQVEITKSYGTNEFHEDLKKLLLDAGLKEQPTVFLIQDTILDAVGGANSKGSAWDDINNILNSGEVPNLFNAEDQDTIFATSVSRSRDQSLGERVAVCSVLIVSRSRLFLSQQLPYGLSAQEHPGDEDQRVRAVHRSHQGAPPLGALHVADVVYLPHSPPHVPGAHHVHLYRLLQRLVGGWTRPRRDHVAHRGEPAAGEYPGGRARHAVRTQERRTAVARIP
jgi:hypothetical protein